MDKIFEWKGRTTKSSKRIQISREDWFSFLKYDPPELHKTRKQLEIDDQLPRQILEKSGYIKTGEEWASAITEKMQRNENSLNFLESIREKYRKTPFWDGAGALQLIASKPREENKEDLPKIFTLHYISQWLCGEDPSDPIASDDAWWFLSHYSLCIATTKLDAWHNNTKVCFYLDSVISGGVPDFSPVEIPLPDPYKNRQEFIFDKAKDILINREDFLEFIFMEQGMLLKLYNQRISTLETIKQHWEGISTDADEAVPRNLDNAQRSTDEIFPALDITKLFVRLKFLFSLSLISKVTIHVPPEESAART